jgi:hypothetical protein
MNHIALFGNILPIKINALTSHLRELHCPLNQFLSQNFAAAFNRMGVFFMLA